MGDLLRPVNIYLHDGSSSGTINIGVSTSFYSIGFRFTTTQATDIKRVKVKLGTAIGDVSGKTYTLRICTIGGTGNITGDVQSTTFSGSIITSAYAPEWTSWITLPTAASLSTSTAYAVIISPPSADASNYAHGAYETTTTPDEINHITYTERTWWNSSDNRQTGTSSDRVFFQVQTETQESVQSGIVGDFNATASVSTVTYLPVKYASSVGPTIYAPTTTYTGNIQMGRTTGTWYQGNRLYFGSGTMPSIYRIDWELGFEWGNPDLHHYQFTIHAGGASNHGTELLAERLDSSGSLNGTAERTLLTHYLSEPWTPSPSTDYYLQISMEGSTPDSSNYIAVASYDDTGYSDTDIVTLERYYQHDVNGTYGGFDYKSIRIDLHTMMEGVAIAASGSVSVSPTYIWSRTASISASGSVRALEFSSITFASWTAPQWTYPTPNYGSPLTANIGYGVCGDVVSFTSAITIAGFRVTTQAETGDVSSYNYKVGLWNMAVTGNHQGSIASEAATVTQSGYAPYQTYDLYLETPFSPTLNADYALGAWGETVDGSNYITFGSFLSGHGSYNPATTPGLTRWYRRGRWRHTDGVIQSLYTDGGTQISLLVAETPIQTSGEVTASRTLIALGHGDAAASGTVSVSVTVLRNATCSATGTVAAAKTLSSPSSFSGEATMTATQSEVIRSRVADVSATALADVHPVFGRPASMAGEGSGSAAITRPIGAAYSGTANLVAAGRHISRYGIVELDIVATLNVADATIIRGGLAWFTATADLVVEDPSWHYGFEEQHYLGECTFVAAGRVIRPANPTMAGEGSCDASGRRYGASGVAFLGEATMTATGNYILAPAYLRLLGRGVGRGVMRGVK